MIRFICTMLLAWAWLGSCLGQSPLYSKNYTDSLLNILGQDVNDSTKALANFKLSYYWSDLNDTTKAKKHLLDGRKLARKNSVMDARSYAVEGYYYDIIDQAKSERAYYQAENILKNLKGTEAYSVRASVWLNISRILQYRGDDEGFMNLMLNKAIPYALAAKDTARLGTLYVGVATGFMNSAQYDKAEAYFDKAFGVMKNSPPGTRASTYNKAGDNYLRLGKLDKVKEVLDSNKLLLAAFPESPLNAPYHTVAGRYQHEKKAYLTAIDYFRKALKEAAGSDEVYIKRDINFYLSKSLIGNRQFGEAEHILRQLAAERTSKQDLMEVYKGLSEVYEGTRQPDSALSWYKKYRLLYGEFLGDQTKKDINELEVKYRQAENERKIAGLQAEKAATALDVSRSRMFNGLLGAACLLLLTIAVFSYVYIKNARKLAEQKEINHQQQLREMEQQHQLSVTRSMLKGEEYERQRIARDLHDGLGGLLAGVKLQLSGWATRRQIGAEENSFHDAITQLDHSSAELRRIAYNMMPETLLRFGLEQALHELCDFCRQNGPRINFECFQLSEELGVQDQTSIYRIVQELLYNTVRHAQATEVMLQCSQNGQHLMISIEDNGKGFDISQLENKRGMGLNSVKTRVDYMSGRLDIQSAPDEGTSIHIECSLSIPAS